MSVTYLFSLYNYLLCRRRRSFWWQKKYLWMKSQSTTSLPPSLLFQIPSHITFLKLTVNTKWNRSHKDLILSFQRLRRYISFARNISHKFWILVLSNQLFIQFQCRCFQNIENNLQIAFGFNRLKIKQQGNVGNCLRTPQLKLMSPKK